MISYFVLRTPLKDECLKRWLPCCLSFLLRFGFFAGKQSKSTSPLKKNNARKRQAFQAFLSFQDSAPFLRALRIRIYILYILSGPTHAKPFLLGKRGTDFGTWKAGSCTCQRIKDPSARFDSELTLF